MNATLMPHTINKGGVNVVSAGCHKTGNRSPSCAQLACSVLISAQMSELEYTEERGMQVQTRSSQEVRDEGSVDNIRLKF